MQRQGQQAAGRRARQAQHTDLGMKPPPANCAPPSPAKPPPPNIVAALVGLRGAEGDSARGQLDLKKNLITRMLRSEERTCREVPAVVC